MPLNAELPNDRSSPKRLLLDLAEVTVPIP